MWDGIGSFHVDHDASVSGAHLELHNSTRDDWVASIENLELCFSVTAAQS